MLYIRIIYHKVCAKFYMPITYNVYTLSETSFSLASYIVCTACSKTSSSCFYQRPVYCMRQHACIHVEFLHAVHVPVLCD